MISDPGGHEGKKKKKKKKKDKWRAILYPPRNPAGGQSSCPIGDALDR